MKIQALKLADYVVNYCNKHNKKISNIVLQKYLYFIQGYYLAVFHKPLFGDKLEKWEYGPAVPYVYYHIVHDTYFDLSIATTNDNVILPLKEKEIALIDLVINACLEYTPSSLIALSQETDPVKWVSKGEEISEPSMAYYFSTHNPLDI